jgi:putative membrane protein
MIIELILALLLGIFAGTFTGLAPGIHINLVAAFLLISLEKFQTAPLLALAVFIVAMSITHVFLDFIPSIYLGAPEEDTFLSVLPGHRMLKKGRAHEAVVLTLYGSLTAIPIVLLFTPIYTNFLPSFYDTIKFLIPYILIFISFYLILREKNPMPSFLVFSLSGILGFTAFNLPIEQPLTPLLSGLFGISGLLVSLKNKTSPQKQKIRRLKKIKLPIKQYFKAAIASFIAGPLCSFLPGIGSGHAATIGSELFPQKTKGFLVLTGAISTIVMALSFVTIYAIGKARSGTAAAVKELLGTATTENLKIILIVIIITAIFSFFLAIKISKIFAKFLNKINYSRLTIFIIVFLIAVNTFFSNLLGLLILITSTSLGVFCVLSNSRRINLMGALIIPAVIYYLF